MADLPKPKYSTTLLRQHCVPVQGDT